MTQAADPIPSVREELERKTLDELVRLAEQVELGHMESSAAAECARSVWNVISGLVSTDTSEAVAALVNAYPRAWRRVHYFRGGDVVSFAWPLDKDDVIVTKRGLSFSAPEHSKVTVDRMARHALLQKLFAGLEAGKWTRL